MLTYAGQKPEKKIMVFPPLVLAMTLQDMKNKPPESVSSCQPSPLLSSNALKDGNYRFYDSKQEGELHQICYPNVLPDCLSLTWIGPGKEESHHHASTIIRKSERKKEKN